MMEDIVNLTKFLKEIRVGAEGLDEKRLQAFVEIECLLGPASPEMLGVLMQRTFWQVRDTVQAQTQAVISFAICAAVGILYVRAIARSRRGSRS